MPVKLNRNDAEIYTKDIFASHYGANIKAFMPTILTLSNKDKMVGSVGINPGLSKSSLVEKYLNLPIEEEIKQYINRNVSRDEIIEVGNMVTSTAGGSISLIFMLTAFLKITGYKYVIFTSTPLLLNSFKNLGLNPKFLAFANKEKISYPDNWGTYYESNPRVVFGCVNDGYRSIQSKIVDSHYGKLAKIWEKSLQIGQSYSNKNLPDYLNLEY